jgi:hypothetical protein
VKDFKCRDEISTIGVRTHVLDWIVEKNLEWKPTKKCGYFPFLTSILEGNSRKRFVGIVRRFDTLHVLSEDDSFEHVPLDFGQTVGRTSICMGKVDEEVLVLLEKVARKPGGINRKVQSLANTIELRVFKISTYVIIKFFFHFINK